MDVRIYVSHQRAILIEICLYDFLLCSLTNKYYRLKVWKSPKYGAYIKKGKLINEGSYVCEVLAPLLNIVMSDLPGNPIAWDIW